MLVTFGATFCGVIASFLLWFGGQWWIKRISNKSTVEHMLREIRGEILRNVDILSDCERSVPTMLAGGNIPVYLPHRMKILWYRRFVSSGELRLLDNSRREWVEVAGWHGESWNEFVNNTEMLLVMIMQRPNAVMMAHKRLEGLVAQAQENITSLRLILENI